MQTHPHQTAAHRGTISQEPGHRSVADSEPLTPAERIALTIALINGGLDVVDGVARTCLARCAPRALRGRHDPEQDGHPVRVT